MQGLTVDTNVASHRHRRPHSRSISRVHAPVLKGVGKSDCAVRIVHINDCERLVPLELLATDDGAHLSTHAWELEAILDRARSPSPCALNDALTCLSLGGSRSARIRKAIRRPDIARRDTPPRTPCSLSFAKLTKNGHVNSSTIRRLTSGMWAVRKEARNDGIQDGSRLLKQIRKQIAFSAHCRTDAAHSNITTPEIYGIRKDETGIVVDMEYIPFYDVKHVMLTQDKSANEWLVNTSISIVDSELAKSTMAPLQSVLPGFEKKASSVKTALAKKVGSLVTMAEMDDAVRQIDAVMSHFQARGNLEVPLGVCHGDLTFQNVLVDFNNRELCIFDFLDSFVESPLQDIAKLLQDCKHLWFLTQVGTKPEERARIITMLGLFHDTIVDAYYDYSIWEVLPLFEFFCLARILPYMTHEREKVCILTGMATICNDLHKPGPAISRFGLDSTTTQECEESDKVTVIVPAMGDAVAAVGKDGRPKLMTLDGTSTPRLVRCISGMGTASVSGIIIALEKSVVLRACGSIDAFEAEFELLPVTVRCLLHFHYNDQPTQDVIETVERAISQHRVTGPLFIKEADNDFAFPVEAGNYLNLVNIVRADHNVRLSSATNDAKHPQIEDATHKSYVGFTFDNVVANLAYGSFVSASYCCGGWGFLDTSDFVNTAHQIRSSCGLADLLIPGSIRRSRSDSGTFNMTDRKSSQIKLQITDIVWKLILHNHLFFGVEVDKYVDWGHL